MGDLAKAKSPKCVSRPSLVSFCHIRAAKDTQKQKNRRGLRAAPRR